MPVTLRRLSQDEAARAFPRRGQMDLAEYTEALHGLQIGDSAELDLGNLSVRAAKRRLGQAATQVGYRLKWARASNADRLYFQVLPAAGSAASRGGNGRRGPRRARRAAAPAPAPTQPAVTSAQAPAPARRRRGARNQSQPA